MKLLVATRNEGKFREVARIFQGTPIRIVSLAEVGVEPSGREEERLEAGDSFAANALSKADHFHARTGLPTLADDSGLRVDVLGGEPGVWTKRFAPAAMRAEHGTDRANNLYLLERLSDVPDEKRTASFVCAVALVLNDDRRVFGGRVEGRIARELRGDGGFGYDPLFYLPDRGCTTAELEPDEKNEISHRGQAVRKARDWLLARFVGETSGPGAR